MKTILFLDVDGVLSIFNKEDVDERKERWPSIGVVWPIPMAYHLVRAIDNDTRLLPVWMSAWDIGALEWNRKANTKLWSVAYHLPKIKQTWALKRFPKLLAVRWFLRHYPRNPVVWIEDGFSRETEDWAVCHSVRLVNTWPMECETAVYLAKYHEDVERAAREFIEDVVLQCHKHC